MGEHDGVSGPVIDLNADLGESFGRWTLGDDEAMLDLITSANVACGFHAGDPATLLRTVRAAAARGVTIGAQVGYPDLAGFGRRFMDMAAEDLTAAVLYQIGALDGLCRAAGTRVAYVKPHGALYHAVVSHEKQAAAVIAGIVAFGASAGRGRERRDDAFLPVLGLPGSVLLRFAAEAGLTAVPEAFADRGYLPNGTLVPRGESGAMLNDAAAVAARAVQMVTDQTVRAIDGTPVPVAAKSLCVHGDSQGAVEMARGIRAAFAAAHVGMRPFAGNAR